LTVACNHLSIATILRAFFLRLFGGNLRVHRHVNAGSQKFPQRFVARVFQILVPAFGDEGGLGAFASASQI